MHPTLRIAVRITLFFLIIFVAVQPFNLFCKITSKCQPFYFSYYLPKLEGKTPINVALEVTNYRKDLDFSASEPAIATVGGRKNIATYFVKNLSDREIRFRPALQIEPENLDKYVIRYECLCSNEYKLKKNEFLELKMRFEISKKIEKEQGFLEDGVIKIRYKIR